MSADPLRVTNNNNNNNIGMNKGDKFNHILFSHHDNTKASTRLSLLSVYFQAFAYYDSILTAAAFPLQLLIFIYKYNILYYDSSNFTLYRLYRRNRRIAYLTGIGVWDELVETRARSEWK